MARYRTTLAAALVAPAALAGAALALAAAKPGKYAANPSVQAYLESFTAKRAA